MLNLRQTFRIALIATLATTTSCSAAGKLTGNSKLNTALTVVAVGTTIAFAGVGKPSGGSPPNKAEPNSDINNPQHSGVQSCVAGNAEQNLEIIAALEQSMHELVVCGGMSQRFAVSFYDTLINTARGMASGPKGFKYLGDGRYEAGGMMVVSLHLANPTSFGSAGDPIRFDVFDIGSYFADAHVEVKAGSGAMNADISIAFSSQMQGAELLGNLVSSNGHIKLDFKKLVDLLGLIELRQEITVDDQRGSVAVNYNVVGEPVPIKNLVFAQGSTSSSSNGAPLNILGATATNSDVNQTLTITNWDMAFAGGSAQTLDGSISFEVHGGDFDYQGTFVYPHRASPDIQLTCL
jgi:hypothetical protein